MSHTAFLRPQRVHTHLPAQVSRRRGPPRAASPNLGSGCKCQQVPPSCPAPAICAQPVECLPPPGLAGKERRPLGPGLLGPTGLNN